MKEDAKMKENMVAEPMGTMPPIGAMQQMQAVPDILPAQTNPMGVMPSMMNQMGMMPSMMNQMPVICCPYLMNMQCPMPFSQNVMGMGMMNNPMFPGASPVAGNLNPAPGVAGSGMNPIHGMGMMPSMNPYYNMGGM